MTLNHHQGPPGLGLPAAFMVSAIMCCCGHELSKPIPSHLSASISHPALQFKKKKKKSSRYLGGFASSGCRACSRLAPCLSELGLAYSGGVKRLPGPSRVPSEADQCAGRTRGWNLPVSHAQCQAEQNPIRPVPPLALRSFIQHTHSLLSSQPVSFSSVGSRSVPSAPLGRSKSPRRSVTRPRLSFCVQ